MVILSFFLLFDVHSNIFAIYNDKISFNLSKGYVNGDIKLFIATDSSDNQTASAITESLGQKINYAPILTSIPKLYLQ